MQTHNDQIVLADLFDYPSIPFKQTHPDRLAVLGLLAGMQPAPVERCRVLELACGEGANLLSMAYTLPHSTFLGVDLGRNPIDKANAAVDAVGLKNVRFVCENLLAFDPGGQEFDYVIAHGFYSWVPQIVRDRLMALISQVLAPQGVAYISYNVYPGCYSGKRLRDFAMMHLDVQRAANPGSLVSPGDQILATCRVLQLLNENQPADPSPARADLFYEAGLVLDRPPALIFHDVLADHWDPFTLRQFVDHAGAHGLQFLDEATPAEPDMPKVPEPILKFIRETCGGDRILEMQYIDFIVARRFRRTLLCRQEIALQKQDRVGVIDRMHVSTQLTESKSDPDGTVTFSIPDLVTLSTPSAPAISIIRRLIAASPGRVAVKEFEGDDAESNQALHGLFLRMYRAGSVDLHTQSSLAGAPTGRPLASALVRYQAAKRAVVTNLVHQAIEMKDEDAAWFLNLCDGTRDHEALLEEAARKFPSKPRSELANHLYMRLEELRKLAILHDQNR